MVRRQRRTSLCIGAIVSSGLVIAASAPVRGEVISWDGGGDGTSWHDELNWDPDRLPGPGDDVLIVDPGSQAIVIHSTGDDSISSLSCAEELILSGGTLSIAAASSVSELTISSSATLGGAGNLTISGPLSWTGGVMDGAGTTFAQGSVELDGGADLRRDFESSGTTTWPGGRIYISAPAVFTNQPNAVFDARSDEILWWQVNGPGTFDNRGTFRKSAGDGVTDVRVPLQNTGVVQVETGTLMLRADSTHTGEVTGAGGLQIVGGVNTFESVSILSVGDLMLNGGTTDFYGEVDLAGNLSVTSGTHTFHPEADLVSVGDAPTIGGGLVDFSSGEALTFTTYTQSGGTLTGDRDVSVTGDLVWTGGVMDGAGTTFALGSVELGGGADLRRDLESSGTTTWPGGRIYISAPAVFTNQPNAVFDARSDEILWWQVNGPGTFDNRGTFRKSAGDGVTDVRVPLQNTGVVQVETGTLMLRADSTHTGEVTGAGGLQIVGGVNTFESVSILSVGDLMLNGGTTDFYGEVDLAGNLSVTSGTHTFHPEADLVSVGDAPTIGGGLVDFSSGEALTFTTYTQSGGTLTGDSDVSVTGDLVWTGGLMDGAGTTFAQGSVELGGGADLRRDLESSGTTTWPGGRIYISAPAVFTNQPGAVFDARSDEILWWQVNGPGTFDNRGTFRKSAGDGVTDVRVLITNSGAVEVLSGTLAVRDSDYVQTGGSTRVETTMQMISGVVDLQGGDLAGDGTVQGNVGSVGGSVRPGWSPGELTIEGLYVQGDGGTLVTEIAGVDPEAYDVLTVDGDAELAGFLTIPRLDGFVPEVGQVFTILTTTGSVLDEFDLVDCPAIYRVDYLAQAVTLTVIQEQPLGDINCDGQVNFADVLLLLAAWGDCPDPPDPCPGDLDGDGDVDFSDVLLILTNWT